MFGKIAGALLLTFAFAAPAHAALPSDALAIEASLARLGLPVGVVDGVWDKDTGRATCAWRELTGRESLRSWPTVSERQAVKATTALSIPKYMHLGININLQCQTAVWLVQDIVEVPMTSVDPTTGQTLSFTIDKPGRSIERVMPVSSGQAAFPTVPGTHVVGWSVNHWWQSTIYADGKMYRPFFFHRGQALHGSSSDDLVKWYPASHGCVRMLHSDIDALWAGGFGNGDTVFIYGIWKG